MPDVSAERPAGAVPIPAPPLAELTTLRLGGPPRRLVVATNPEEVIGSVRVAASSGEAVLVLGGGSNVVVADSGYPGTVVLLRNRGLTVVDKSGDGVTVRVAAGEPWDEVVDEAVASGWSGIECLAGIPGNAGSTPIQNVGAYGQEVAETIVGVRAYDRLVDEVVSISAADCDFGYRSSRFKRNDRWVVLSVDFRLWASAESRPIRYAELARTLGVPVGGTVPLAAARDAVRALRAGKGMVLDPADPDTRSVGSFFTNPVLDPAAYAALRERSAGYDREPPAWPGTDGLVKVSAAWLIEHAGFEKGYARGGVAISSKHTLALTNRAGSTAELLALAREIRDGVHARFGVTLHPEVVLVRCEL